MILVLTVIIMIDRTSMTTKDTKEIMQCNAVELKSSFNHINMKKHEELKEVIEKKKEEEIQEERRKQEVIRIQEERRKQEEVRIQEEKRKQAEDLRNAEIKRIEMNEEKIRKEKEKEKKIADAYNQDVILLAKLIQSEALAEPYEGKVAVGAVVINRLNSKKYPNTLNDVIYQGNGSQFHGTRSKLFKREPSEDCIKASKEALSGVDNTNGALFFLNRNISNPDFISRKTFIRRIGDHWFYK